jgi:hypothetical protein
MPFNDYHDAGNGTKHLTSAMGRGRGEGGKEAREEGMESKKEAGQGMR